MQIFPASSTKEERWQRLLSAGLLGGSYCQRVSACFGFLDSLGTGYFSLSDFMEKGVYVESFLSLAISTEKSFPLMDSFRKFDINGDGLISLEEFAFSIMQRLEDFSKDSCALEDIALNLMPAGSKNAAELLIMLKSEDFQNDSTRKRISAIAYLIEKELEVIIASPDEAESLGESVGEAGPSVESAALVALIKEAIKKAVFEIALRFHFTRKKCLSFDIFRLAEEETASLPTTSHGRRVSFATPVACNWRRFRTVKPPAEMAPSDGDGGLDLLSDNDDGASTASDSGDSEYSSSAGSFDGSSGVVATEVAPYSSPRELDAAELFLLQLMQSSIEGIVSGEGGHLDRLAELLLPRPPATSATSAPPVSMQPIVPEDQPLVAFLSQQLSTTQLKLARTEARLQLFELLQDNIAANMRSERQLATSRENISDNENQDEEDEEDEEDDSCAVNDLIKELVELKSCLAFRGTAESFLGQAASDPRALVPLLAPHQAPSSSVASMGYDAHQIEQEGIEDMEDEEEEEEDDIASAVSQSTLGVNKAIVVPVPVPVPVPVALAPQRITKVVGSKELSSKADRHSVTPPCDEITFRDNLSLDLNAIRDYLSAKEKPTSGLPEPEKSLLSKDEMSVSGEETNEQNTDVPNASDRVFNRASLRNQLLEAERKIAELSVLAEQANDNRGAVIHMAVELQVLRETACKAKTLEETIGAVRFENKELHERVKALEFSLDKRKEEEKRLEKLATPIINQQSVPVDEASERIKGLSMQVKELTLSGAKLERDNMRLLTSTKLAEENMTKALHENLILRQQVSRLEDSVEGLNALQKHFQDDLVREKAYRSDREQLHSRVQELQRDLSINQANNQELTEELSIMRKTKDELERAEERNNELRDEVARLSMHNDRADLAMQQIEEYRTQLRDQTRSGREQALYVRTLESQLNELKYYQSRNAEMLEEIHVYKLKVEKIPSLLAESARLRAYSKAALKSLSDQDKSVASSLARVAELDREVLRLKNENRLYRDSDNKLRDATAEIKNLHATIADLKSSKDNVKMAEEGRKNMETQYKKMLKFARQSIISSTTNPSNSGDGFGVNKLSSLADIAAAVTKSAENVDANLASKLFLPSAKTTSSLFSSVEDDVN